MTANRRGRNRSRAWLRRLRRSPQSLAMQVDDEIRFHLDTRVAELIAGGVPPHAASEQARREFGDQAASRRELVRVDRGRLARQRFGAPWSGLVRDLGYAARSLVRQPGFSLVVMITLALAIGANAAVFGIIDRLILRGAEHVRDADRVVRVYGRIERPGRGTSTTPVFGYVTYSDLRAGSRSFERIGAYRYIPITAGQGAGARSLRGAHATWDFFQVLGVRPRLGRFFTEAEDRVPRGLPAAVLGEEFWRVAYGGDPDILGRRIHVENEELTVVGVAPRGFTGAELGPVDLWLPMAFGSRHIRTDWPTTRSSSWLRIVARLRDGVTATQAGDEATAVHRRSAASSGELRSRARLEALPISRDTLGNEPREATVSRWLVGVSAIVLLIAVANTANLQLARGTRRRRELAIRVALGISRLRLMRLVLLESLVLAAAGAALGIVLAYRGTTIMRALLLPEVAWTSSPVHSRLLVFSALVALLAGVLAGIVPALLVTRTDLVESLKTGAREGGGRGSRIRGVLLLVQPALAAILLVGAGLFVHSLHRVRSIDIGFEPDRALWASVQWNRSEPHPWNPVLGPGFSREDESAEQARREAFYAQAAELLRAEPWVEQASVAIGAPFYTSFGVDVRLHGRDALPGVPGGGPNIFAVAPEYFSTIGLRLVHGRLFSSADRAGSEPVAVVNETMASALWPGDEPAVSGITRTSATALGQCLTVYDDAIPCVRVVGVVRDSRQWRLQESPPMQFYVPLGQEREIAGPMLFVRPRGEAAASIEHVRATLLRLKPDLPYTAIETVQQLIDPQVRAWRLGASLFLLFGALALVVAAVGLYSMLAYLVEQRRHEYGVRAALGASSGDLTRDALGRGLVPASVGLIIGSAAAYLVAPFLQSLLYETSARDPRIFAAVAVVLIVAAAAGSLVPARRAARVDPATALRAE